MRLIIWTLVAVTAGLGGCAVNRDVRVESNPSGAEVFASSKSLGVTPLLTDVDALFPNRAFDFQPSASRTLIFKKSGYSDATVTITEFSIPPVVAVTLVPSSTSVSTPAVDGVEDRLRKLEKLYREGLITEKEYGQRRQAILDGI